MLTPHQMIMSALGKGSDCLNRLFTTGVITPNQISADLRRDLDTVAPHLAEIVVSKFEEELVRMKPIGGGRGGGGANAVLQPAPGKSVPPGVAPKASNVP